MHSLQGSRLILTPSEQADAYDLLPAFNGDEQFNMWNGGSPVMSIDAVRSDIEQALNMPGGTVWRIADLQQMLIGVAITAQIPPPHGAWIALFIIRQPFQHRGYGTEAAQLLEEELFSHSEIQQIGLAIVIHNTRAQAFWQKRGYSAGLHHRDLFGVESITMRLTRTDQTHSIIL